MKISTYVRLGNLPHMPLGSFKTAITMEDLQTNEAFWIMIDNIMPLYPDFAQELIDILYGEV